MEGDLARQVWLRAERLRDLRSPDLSDLVDIASEFAALDWKIVADLSALLDRRRDVMARPRVIMQFIHELSKRRHPRRVLDPFVVNPAVLLSAVDIPSRPEAMGVVHADRAAELGQRLAPDVDWRREDPLLAPPALWDDACDLLVLAPPFGVKVEASLLLEGEPGSLTSEVSDLVLFRALRGLSPSGLAVVHVSDSYFWTSVRLRTRRALESAGYHLSGVFSLADTGASVSSSLIVIARAPVEQLFVGHLKELASVTSLVENFLSRRPGDVIELGRLVPADEYRGWEQYAILSEWPGMIAPIRLGTIARVETRSIAKGETLPSEENTVYIPTIGAGPVKTVPPDYTGKGKYRVLAIGLDPERARADYVAEWLSSAVGVAVRRAFISGSTIPHLTTAGATSMPIDLPSIEAQDQVARAAQQLHAMQSTVISLREALWRDPLAVLSTVAHELTRAARGNPLRASIERLPYPLASVLRRYLAESATDRKVSRLIQYFEATAEFSAILLLSAFCRDTTLFGHVQRKLANNDPEQHHEQPLERVDFGQWITLGRTLAKAARRVMGEKALAPAWSQAVRPASAVAELLATKGYWLLFEQARIIRNERAHGGIDSETQYQTWLRQLEVALFQLLQATGSVWESARLLLVDTSRHQGGVWTYPQAKLLMGSNDILEQIEFTCLESLEAGQLVFAPQGLGREILPLVLLVQGRTFRTHSRIACYFYSARESRNTFKYVSYHYEEEPQQTFTDANVDELIRSLSSSDDSLVTD